MKILSALPLLLCAASPAAAQVSGKPIMVSGSCDSTTGVTLDDGSPIQFACNMAVIARTDRGTVLIQFADKKGGDGRILGFAGRIEGKQAFGAERVQIMAVERFYLAAGATPIPAARGTCFMNWTGLQRTGGRLTSVICGGRGEADGSDIIAKAMLKTR